MAAAARRPSKGPNSHAQGAVSDVAFLAEGRIKETPKPGVQKEEKTTPKRGITKVTDTG